VKTGTTLQGRASHGFSLVELSITLALAAILVSLATPGLQRLRSQMQLAESAQALLAALHQARSNADQSRPAGGAVPDRCCGALFKQRAPRALAGRCLSSSTLPVRRSAAQTMNCSARNNYRVALRLYANRSAITYWPQARAGATSTFLLCDAQQRARPRAVIVSQTGRPRISVVAADGSALRCAAG
jgi:type IV fimbrial biogenesis protein FimT